MGKSRPMPVEDRYIIKNKCVNICAYVPPIVSLLVDWGVHVPGAQCFFQPVRGSFQEGIL